MPSIHIYHHISSSYKIKRFKYINKYIKKYTAVDPKQWVEKCFEEQVQHMK